MQCSEIFPCIAVCRSKKNPFLAQSVLGTSLCECAVFCLHALIVFALVELQLLRGKNYHGLGECDALQYSGRHIYSYPLQKWGHLGG